MEVGRVKMSLGWVSKFSLEAVSTALLYLFLDLAGSFPSQGLSCSRKYQVADLISLGPRAPIQT
jgi:hypothetical protein